MEHITSAGNTAVPAYLVLVQAGLNVQRRLAGDIEEWVAERDGLRISGSSTVELLGLWLMRQQRGGSWKAQDSEIDDFLRRFYPEADR